MTGPAAGRRRWAVLAESGPLLPVLLLLTVVYTGPVLVFLGSSFVLPDGSIGLENYYRVFSSLSYVNAIVTTFKLALATTILSILIGYPVAWFMANSPAGRSLVLLVVLPFWTSYLVRIFAWIVLLGRHGVVNAGLMATGLTDRPLELSYNVYAVLTAMTHAMLPLAILTMLSTMKNIGRDYSRAASVLGARGAQSFFRVYLPLSMPGVAAAALMVFIVCLGFFMTPALLGSRKEVVITQIIIDQLDVTLDWGFASAISVLLLATALLMIGVYNNLFGLTALTGMASGARKAGVRELLSGHAVRAAGACGHVFSACGRACERLLRAVGVRAFGPAARSPLLVVVALVLGFLLLPVLFLIPVSFSRASFMGWPPDLFTVRWYTDYLTGPVWLSAFVRSLAIAGGAALIASVVGTPAAFALIRSSLPGKPTLMSYMILPMLLPHMILAIALFALYARIGLLGSMLGLMIAHAVLAVPYVVITVSSVLRNYDQRLDQAAAVLGARPLRTFRTVTLPLIGTGMLSAFIFSFISSFDEITVSLFLTGGLMTTLPKQMWQSSIDQVTPGLAAVSTVVLLLLTAVLVVVAVMQRRGGSTAAELRG